MEEKEKRAGGFTGVVFVGCILLGMGIGILVGQREAGIFIGIGVGFILMGLLRAKYKKW